MTPYKVYKPITSLLAVTLAAAFLFYGCGGSDLPVEKIKKALKDSPTYSVILEDMKEDGNFFKDYYHKYEVVQEGETGTTDWLEVPENYYRTNEAFLGMTIASKKDGKTSSEVAPPGYHHVGDTRYGHWRTDHRGSSFWEFYGKYAMFSTLLGGFNRPIYRDDYNMYQRNRSSGMPYYGRNNQYGTNGSITKQAKPDFYSRRTAKNASFKDRVKKRTGRTRTGYRGRSGRVGK